MTAEKHTLFFFLLFIVKCSRGQSTDYPERPQLETLPCGSSSFLDVDQSVAIETPNYPDQYGPFQKCFWKIKVPPSSNVSIDCGEFDLDRSDKFCIKDKKERSKSKCYKGTGSWLEDPYTFSTYDSRAKFVIQFRSRRRGEGYGFR